MGKCGMTGLGALVIVYRRRMENKKSYEAKCG